MNEDLALSEEGQPVDYSRKILRRIFNNNSWEQGGRFYHGWWMEIPKSYRKYVTIDDKATVEVDFSRMHPEMIYAKYAGKVLTFDPYNIDTTGRISRDLGKTIFNIMINSSDRSNGYGAIREALKKEGLPSDRPAVNDAINLFETEHTDIRAAFFSGAGIELQFIDSQIAERVMLFWASETHYVALPVHDSFLVHHLLAEELQDKMIEEFENITMSSIGTDHSRPYFETDPPDPDDVDKKGHVTEDIELLMKPFKEYSEYFKRLHEFRERKGRS